MKWFLDSLTDCNKTKAAQSLIYITNISSTMTTSFSFRKVFMILGVLILFQTFQVYAQPAYPRNPKKAQLIFSDLDHFVDAYEELSRNTDTIQVLQTLYFERGSDGLKEFVRRHQLTPERLKEAIRENPERYVLLPGFVSKIGDIQELYTLILDDFHKVVPNAMYPPTYLIVGANRGIGQASMAGQLITVTRIVDNMDKMKKMIVHELAHFQQAMAMGGQKYAALYASRDNMLGMCLREGGAEFVTSQVMGNITQNTALEYLEKDENRLKEQFLTDTKAQNKDFWFWPSLEHETYTKLLGYAIGYKICNQYYEEAPDKTAAFIDILKMEDAELFLKLSHYFNR